MQDDSVVEAVNEEDYQESTPDQTTQQESMEEHLVAVNEKVDEEVSTQNEIPAKEEPSKEPAQPEQVKEEVEQTPKRENFVPQARFNQVNRKMRIFENTVKYLVKQNQELLNAVKGTQSQPQTQQPLDASSLENLLNQRDQRQQEQRQIDESISWLEGQAKELVTKGISTDSFASDINDILISENLRANLSPLEASKKAFEIYKKEYVIEEPVAAAPVKTEASNQGGNPKQAEVAPAVKTPEQIRTENKIKATGISKTRTAEPKVKAKEMGNHYYAYDEPFEG